MTGDKAISINTFFTNAGSFASNALPNNDPSTSSCMALDEK